MRKVLLNTALLITIIITFSPGLVFLPIFALILYLLDQENTQDHLEDTFTSFNTDHNYDLNNVAAGIR